MVFAVPKVRETVFMDDQRKISLWLTRKVTQLKKKTLLQKQTHILHIDVDANRYWVTTAAMPDDQKSEAAENSFAFPEGITVRDVEFPEGGQISSGTVLIHFYPKGYSDNVFIHLLISDHDSLSLHIEPFLNTASIYDDYVGFTD
jgi:hypothetical protein